MKNIKKVCFIIILITMFNIIGCNKKGDSTTTNNNEVDTSKVEIIKNDDNKEDEITNPWKNFSIGKTISKYGVKFGAAVEPHLLDDPLYTKALVKDFTVLTPENYMKWQFIHPQRDTYYFEGADKIVEFAKEHNMDVRGHALVWHIQNPDWLEKGNFSKEEMEAILKDHIENVVGHYKGDVYAWDVVNEPLDGHKMRNTIWYDTIGEDYIEKALRWAHEVDPEAKLFINDYSIEMPGQKSDAMYELCKNLLDKGAPLHGVGFQFHMDLHTPFDVSSVYNNLKRFADLGLIVDITELDIRMSGSPTQELLEEQAKYYGDFMDIALALDNLNSFTLWGVTDKYSWIPGYFTGMGHALILDENYNIKPAYNALATAAFRGPTELEYLKPIDTSNRELVAPLKVKKTSIVPEIDGNDDEEVWENAYEYSFSYNQLDTKNQCIPNDEDNISGKFKMLYKDNYLYGVVYRKDDTTINTIQGETYKNDNVEVFVEYNDYFEQMRSIVGYNFEENGMDTEKLSVWNDDGTIMEFMVKLPEEDMTGLTVGFNIALSDNDSGNNRACQLYPIAGENKSYLGKDLTLLLFEGDTPRATNYNKVIPPLKAVKAISMPTVDGNIEWHEWSEGTIYGMSYDLIDEYNYTLPKYEDAFIQWKINYNENKIFGYVEVQDNETIINDEINNSDHIEINLFKSEEESIVIKTMANGKEDVIGNISDYEIKWNDNMNKMEFLITLKDNIEPTDIVPFNIIYYDYDKDSLSHILSPFAGTVDENYTHYGEIQFTN